MSRTLSRRAPRPLDFLRSIKVKLGVVIALAVVTAYVVNEIGFRLNYKTGPRVLVAIVLSLVMVQVMAHGMVAPLREMAAAARAMARGDYRRRVRASSQDEVGELARAFNVMAADLAAVDRQRRDLIANVSHELRTPIAGLQAVLENLVDGVGRADPDTLRTALAQTERLGGLVARLLDLSRLDSGAIVPAMESVRFAGLCAQAADEAQLAAGDRAVQVSVTVSPADLTGWADPALLLQVLANLLDNAVRHSPADGTVSVTAEPYGPAQPHGPGGRPNGGLGGSGVRLGGSGVRLGVTDEGPGIPEAERERIFERFSRLEDGRARGGAGLGLAIARELTELHGGTLRAESAPGGGCRMIVDLPAPSQRNDRDTRTALEAR